MNPNRKTVSAAPGQAPALPTMKFVAGGPTFSQVAMSPPRRLPPVVSRVVPSPVVPRVVPSPVVPQVVPSPVVPRVIPSPVVPQVVPSPSIPGLARPTQQAVLGDFIGFTGATRPPQTGPVPQKRRKQKKEKETSSRPIQDFFKPFIPAAPVATPQHPLLATAQAIADAVQGEHRTPRMTHMMSANEGPADIISKVAGVTSGGKRTDDAPYFTKNEGIPWPDAAHSKTVGGIPVASDTFLFQKQQHSNPAARHAASTFNPILSKKRPYKDDEDEEEAEEPVDIIEDDEDEEEAEEPVDIMEESWKFFSFSEDRASTTICSHLDSYATWCTLSAGINMAPDLAKLLSSPQPPSMAELRRLPTYRPGSPPQWGIYILILEKSGSRPAIYVGSGTDSTGGVGKRFRDYNNSTALPVKIQEWMGQGYQITYKAIVCSSPIPAVAKRWATRAVFKVLETMLTSALWAYIACKSPDLLGLPEICPWLHTPLPYDGLCTHAAFIEGVNFGSSNPDPSGMTGAEDTPPSQELIQQLETLAEERWQAYLAKLRANYHMLKEQYPQRWRAMADKKNAYASKKWFDRKENNPEEHRAFTEQYNERYGEAKAAQQAAKYLENIQNEVYICSICPVAPFGHQRNLDRHLKSSEHIARENGTYVPPKSRSGELKFRCEFCEEEWAEEWNLILHQRENRMCMILLAEREGRPPPPENEKLQCPYCEKEYTQSHNLDKHIGKHHADRPPVINAQLFLCHICPEIPGWKTIKLRNAHQRKSHLHAVRAAVAEGRPPPPTPAFFCPTCGYPFKTARSLEVHRTNVRCHGSNQI